MLCGSKVILGPTFSGNLYIIEQTSACILTHMSMCECHITKVSVCVLCDRVCEHMRMWANQAVMSCVGQQKDIIVSGAPWGSVKRSVFCFPAPRLSYTEACLWPGEPEEHQESMGRINIL